MNSDEDKEYDAILVDTSVFDQYGLRLEKGLLGKLNQFKDSEIHYLFPDVIKGEVEDHLCKNAKSARESLEKAINKAAENLLFESSGLKDSKPYLISNDEAEGIARCRVNRFVENTGAIVIECGNYVSIKELLHQYFQNEPPFAEKGVKKHEFPDAIVLLATEKWAKEKDVQVLAIAGDNDWKSYCETSAHIDYTNNFVDALTQFNKATAPFTFLSLLTTEIDNTSDESKVLLNKIYDAVITYFYDFLPEIEAHSTHYWEEYCSHGWLTNFELDDYDFKIIDHGKDQVVLEVNANFEVRVECDFSLTHYDSSDREYIPLKDITKIVDEQFSSGILITICGDLNGKLSDLDIEDIEIINPLTLVDFGMLEIDYGKED